MIVPAEAAVAGVLPSHNKEKRLTDTKAALICDQLAKYAFSHCGNQHTTLATGDNNDSVKSKTEGQRKHQNYGR